MSTPAPLLMNTALRDIFGVKTAIVNGTVTSQKTPECLSINERLSTINIVLAATWAKPYRESEDFCALFFESFTSK
jgi:hypothetical protein